MCRVLAASVGLAKISVSRDSVRTPSSELSSDARLMVAAKVCVTWKVESLASGKRLHNYGKIHHFQWVNPLFLWLFSIAM